MTSTDLRPQLPVRERPNDAERTFARRRALVHRGVVASYLHGISARHPHAPAAA